MIGLVKRLAGIVLPFVAALVMLQLMGSDWYDWTVSTITELIVRVVTGAMTSG